MKRLALSLLALVALLVVSGSAAAAGSGHNGPDSVAYTISNDVAGNALVAYDRAGDGTLSSVGSTPAGGLGTGAGLASQGSVVLTDDGRTVLAVNPGSNTVAAFSVDRDGPHLLGTAPSGGNRPVSIAVDKKLVYVLNKDNSAPATVSGFRLDKDGLTPIAGSTRLLHAGATDAAQVSFTPKGDTLVISGRSSNAIDTYSVEKHGLLGVLKTFDVAPGTLPFGFDFDKKGNLIVSIAGVGSSSGAASYDVGKNGTITTITAPIETGQQAACWVVTSKDSRFAFVANTASSTVSTFSVGQDGSIAFLTAVPLHGVTAIDEAISEDGRYLYVVAAGSDTIVQFAIGRDGTLTYVGTTSTPANAVGLAVR